MGEGGSGGGALFFWGGGGVAMLSGGWDEPFEIHVILYIFWFEGSVKSYVLAGY